MKKKLKNQAFADAKKTFFSGCILTVFLLLILFSGCTTASVRTTDLLYVDYLNIYPSNILNTNDIAQISMRVSNTGQSEAYMVLEERKIKRYYLWENEVNNTDLIFREGNSWYIWANPDAKIKNYAEYTIESDTTGDHGGQVRLISTDIARTETVYEITNNYITLMNDAYITGLYDIEGSEAILATDVSLPDYKESQFKASSILVQHCGSLYQIKDFDANPFNEIDLFKSSTKANRAGEDSVEYARSVIVGRHTLLNPKDSIELIWKIKAPSNEETAGLTQPCQFKFNVKYSAKAKSEAHIYFANPLEIIQQSITDQDLSLKGTVVRIQS